MTTTQLVLFNTQDSGHKKYQLTINDNHEM